MRYWYFNSYESLASKNILSIFGWWFIRLSNTCIFPKPSTFSIPYEWSGICYQSGLCYFTIVSVNTLFVSFWNLCWDFNIVLLFSTPFLKYWKFISCLITHFLCAFSLLTNTSIICDIAMHLRPQGYKSFSIFLPNSCFISPITFLFLLIGSGQIHS